MRIGDMFLKDINRDIKGVIKVGQDDNSNAFQELNEYVVTKELSKHFRVFFENYKKGIVGNTDKMGVWISGFFGSGKSHFLKILSYLLENKEVKDKEVNNKKAIDFFTDGEKIQDSMVIADMDLATNTTTDVILFNIDSKSSADSKSNKEAIVEVFLKVFNEMQGFCGSIPFLADLERKLCDDGKYEEFKQKYEEVSGNKWEETRDEFYFIQDEIVQVLSELNIMSEDAARVWCEKADETYNISIDKFASLVKKYCDRKGKNHHVVFLVDEIGQFIAEDTKLMLNLQTVTEDLGTACKGKVWIIVTSQQDIDSVTKVKGNDFSKIQGRFDTRLSLSSSNVDEVIRKRILKKKEIAHQTLTLLYDQKETVIKNLIIFTKDTADKKLYKDREEFSKVYPFIPYQFNLLAQVLTSIRTHGASGKHLAEGERSMLALFQESAVHYMDKTESILVPFNIFYNALDKFIDHTHSNVIYQASQNQKLETFDVELLKVLFMIKYVKEIKGNIDNLTTLMVSDIDEDRLDLRNKVEQSLYRLIKQTLIQKNGDIYMFLTNEEQDINKAIKNETVEMGEIINVAATTIFESIFTDKKYKYSSRYMFPFNQSVDDRYFKNNQINDIGLKIITPYNENNYDDTTLRMLSSQENNVIVNLPHDTTFLDEITECLKIEKYLNKTVGEKGNSLESIRRAKEDERIEKLSRIKTYIEDALKYSDIYVNGDKANINAKDPVSRINEALGKLVSVKYNKLTYMESAPTEIDIENIFTVSNQIKINNVENENLNKLALQDVLNYLQLNDDHKHIKTTLKMLMDRLLGAPYGFIMLDVQWLVASLFKQGKITVTLNSKSITLVNNSPSEIIKYLTKKEYLEKLILSHRIDVPKSQIKTAKEIMKDLFSISSIGDDEDELMQSFMNRTKNKIDEIEDLLKEYEFEPIYPGKKVLSDAKNVLMQLKDITEVTEFYNYVHKNQNELLDIVEEIMPVCSFFMGEQKKIFKKAINYTRLYESSKTYVVDGELIETVKQIRIIINKEKPYGEIYKLPDILDKFENIHVAILEKESADIVDVLESNREQVFNFLNAKQFSDRFKESYIRKFDELREKLRNSKEIAAIKNIRYESSALRDRCINEITDYENELTKKQLAEKGAMTGNEDKTPGYGTKKVIKKKSISIHKLTTNVTFENKNDIEKFVEVLKSKLLKELEEDTVVNLII